MEKKTPLYERHLELGGRMVPFGGYLLPVQYESGIIFEHMSVRTRAGLFDVSHMGEFFLTGKDSLANLQTLLTNDFLDMPDGRVRYSPMCNDSGGVVDDLVVYRFDPEKYLIVVNAANREKDFAWIRERLSGQVTFRDASEEYALLALQGPGAIDILSPLTDPASIPAGSYRFTPEAEVAGVSCILSRTGYTGEDGFELYCAPGDARTLMDALMDAGAVPCGLGARDTLRLEAAMPLYGHELSEEISPIDAGLSRFVRLDKAGFIGKNALLERKRERFRAGLSLISKGIAREGAAVFDGDREIGKVTSGSHAPFLGRAVAMALLPVEYAEFDGVLTIDVRGRRLEAELTPLPFYKKK